jgi:hypothetical protein
MAAAKKAKKVKKKPGRRPTPRKRLGHIEAASVKKLLNVVKNFAFKKGDQKKRETTLNSRLIAALKVAVPAVTNKGIASVTLVGKRYFPECTLSGKAPYAVFAIECKKLHDHSAKRLFKEGLAQAMLYLSKTKIVVLFLYDFTTGAQYKKAFGPGNSDTSRLAGRSREDLGLHIVVRAP